MGLFGKKIKVKTGKKISGYLPIGTIIRINEKKYVISEYMGDNKMPIKYNSSTIKNSKVYNLMQNSSTKTYYHMDYEIYEYPLGATLDIACQYILHEDIEEVVFEGYKDEYRNKILGDVDKFLMEVK